MAFVKFVSTHVLETELGNSNKPTHPISRCEHLPSFIRLSQKLQEQPPSHLCSCPARRTDCALMSTDSTPLLQFKREVHHNIQSLH